MDSYTNNDNPIIRITFKTRQQVQDQTEMKMFKYWKLSYGDHKTLDKFSQEVRYIEG